MKKIHIFLVVITACNLLLGCSEDNSQLPTEGISISKTFTRPFNAEFTGEQFYIGAGCNEAFECHVIINFTGLGGVVGYFNGSSDYCGCGPDGAYGPTTTYMVSADGDTLFVSCEGCVKQGRTNEHPEEVSTYCKDPFIIVGGTGRFEGATGSGYTNDYTTHDGTTYHHWTGNITLIRENQIHSLT